MEQEGSDAEASFGTELTARLSVYDIEAVMSEEGVVDVINLRTSYI